MAYVIPSVLVYQQLETTGGVLNSTPDLDTCIIGPAYNILSYSGTAASQIATAALATTTTTGTTTASSNMITAVAAPGGFSVGDILVVIGAGITGTNLQATITDITANVFTLDTMASTSVDVAVISRKGKITNPAINNTFALPGQKAGQVVAISSIVPWMSNAVVETAVTGSYGYATNNILTINTPTGVTGDILSSSSTLTITTSAMAKQWAIGDVLTVAGAGPAAALLTATITNISGTTFTVTPAAGSTVTGAAVAKVLVSNLNSTTNTLKIEAGDDVKLSYVDVAGVSKTYLNKVRNIVTSSGLNGTLVNLTITDVLPDDFSTAVTTGTVGATSTAMVVASGTGFATGDTIRVYGAGAAGAVLETTATVSGINFTLGVAATTAVTNAKIAKVLRVNGTEAAGQTTITLIAGAAAAFAAGDRVAIVGAGANGSNHVSVINSVSAPDIVLATPTITSVTNAEVKKISNFQLSLHKTYNNQQLANTKPISGGSNFDTSNTLSSGQVTINANSELVYGKVASTDVYFSYKALRTDLSGTVREYNDITDVQGELGVISDENPLALGIQMSLANTTSRIFAVGVPSNDLTGHETALELLENQRMYSLVPLTQDTSILAAYQAHVDQMSTPEEGAWRIVYANTVIPTTAAIGQYSADLVNSNGGNNSISLAGSVYTLVSSNSTFIDDGVVAGDTVNITVSNPSTQQGAHRILSAVSNQQLIIEATAIAVGVSFYVTRTLTKAQQAKAVADASTEFNDKRVIHVQPDLVGIEIDGVTKYLPGYYLCAALGGMTAGFPVQQGFTNVGVAGISDLKHSNYYFSRADLNSMAEKGTFIFAQLTQGGIPFVRHELTTDITVLEYRELLVVKNWDFLSYYFKDKLEGFIGKWNITQDTLNVMRQTMIASAELLKGKKLPKIGPPLRSMNIRKLAQSTTNKDQVDAELLIEVVYPLNYLNLYLII